MHNYACYNWCSATTFSLKTCDLLAFLYMFLHFETTVNDQTSYLRSCFQFSLRNLFPGTLTTTSPLKYTIYNSKLAEATNGRFN